MADFKKAYRITMKHEGGYANDPDDSGGETWKGIARNYNPKWKGWAIVDRIKASKPKSLNAALFADKELEALELAFYEANYWDSVNLDNINSQEVANNLFDVSVNMGSGRAATFLQKSISPPVLVDGKIGPKSIAGANAMNPKILFDNINRLRRQKYDAIIAANPSQAKFKKSWYSRIKPFEQALA